MQRGGGRGWVCTSVHSIRGPTVVISKYNNLKRLVPTGPSFKGQEAFQSISEYEILNFTSPALSTLAHQILVPDKIQVLQFFWGDTMILIYFQLNWSNFCGDYSLIWN